MKRISASTKQRIKEGVDLVALVGESVQLKKSGASYVGLCPFHNEKSGSFNVAPAKRIFHCFGCGESGDAIGWMMKHHGLSFTDAVESLAQRIGLVIEYE